MREPGQKLRRARERLKLKYRDVEEASQRLAEIHENSEFLIGLSRLADIENKGTVPSLYRLYSLCAIYKLNFNVVLEWYGIRLDRLPADSLASGRHNTSLYEVDVSDRFQVEIPLSVDPDFDARRTSYLGEQIQKWGKVPAALLQDFGLRNYRYALVGTEDWSMFPIVPPGAFLQIEDRKWRLELEEPWSSEFDRPILFLEHRNGYRFGWCSFKNNQLTVQSHPASRRSPEVFLFPGEVDVVGRVVGVAMRFDQGKVRHTHS